MYALTVPVRHRLESAADLTVPLLADAVYDASKKYLFGLDDCDPVPHVEDSSEE